MHKKIIGIIICMLFLISSLPTVISVDVKENTETQEDNNAIFFQFGIMYGLIELHGEEFIEDWGMCYNTTAIEVTVHGFSLVIPGGFFYDKMKIEDKELYICKKTFHGIVTNRLVFGFLFQIFIGEL